MLIKTIVYARIRC